MASQYARAHGSAYFRWQYFESFFPTVCMTAWDNEALVGMFGLQRRTLTDGKPVGHFIDLLIDSRYRGRGIFLELARHATAYFRGLAAVTVFPNRSGRDACVKSLGMHQLAKVDDMVLTGPPVANKPLEAATVNQRRFELGFAVGLAYRTWRYDRSPQYRYEILGKGVTKSFRDPLTGECIGDIVDWVAQPAAEEIRETVTQLLERGHTSVSTWSLPSAMHYLDLRSMGFVHVPRERYFCLKALNQRNQFLCDIESWRVVPADAEIY